MSLKSIKKNLHFAIVTIVVILSTLKSVAQNRCESLFGQTTVYSDLFLQIRSAHKSTNDLFFVLSQDKKDVTEKQLRYQTQTILNAIETYLVAAGFSFTAIPKVITVKNILDTDSVLLPYKVFVLEGRPYGDEFSRMIYSAQRTALSAKSKWAKPLRVILDPLYLVTVSKYSRSKFDSQENTILTGIHTFAFDIVGYGSIFRHEIQHMFEEIKIRNGEMTLARTEFENPDLVGEAKYTDYLPLDEIETHLRDLRSLSDDQSWKIKYKKLIQFVDESRVSEYNKIRIETYNEKKATLQRMLSDAQIILSQVGAKINEHEYTIYYSDHGGCILVFDLPKNQSSSIYGQVRINLYGLTKAGSAIERSSLQRALYQILNWQNDRIQSVAKEFRQFR